MNYNSLMNKPTINYRELIGDNTVTEVGGITEEQFNTLLNTDLSSYYTKAQIDDLFSRSYVYREKSGSIVTFDCPSTSQTIPEVTAEIIAVQAGTGDPSPTNVRPISGWSAVNVTRCGKNLFDKVNCGVYNGYIAGTQINSSPNHRTIYIPCKPNTTYSCNNFSGNIRRELSYSSEVPRSGLVVPTPLDTITTNANAKYILCYCYNNITDTVTFDDVKNALDIELGSVVPDTYSAYSGTTYTTTLKDGQDNPMTCYGGTLTNENGVQTLTNNDIGINLGDLEWKGNPSKNYFYATLTTAYKFANNTVFECEVLKSDGYGNSTDGYYPTDNNAFRYYYVSNGAPAYEIYVNASGYTDIADFKSAMSGKILKYELATPQQIPQDSLSIATQEGTNNLWTDSGNITVKALDKIIQE